MGLWASKGHQLDAVEVKVSYSDWCKEWRRVEWVLTDCRGRKIRSARRWSDSDLLRFRGVDKQFNEHLRSRGRHDEIPPAGFDPVVERVQTVDTSKNAEWRTHAHRFWVAAPEKLARKIAIDVRTVPELSGWGVLAITADGPRVMVAPKPNRNPTALDHRQYLGIIRAAADSGLQAIWRAEARGRVTGIKEARAGEERLRQSMWATMLWKDKRDRAG